MNVFMIIAVLLSTVVVSGQVYAKSAWQAMPIITKQQYDLGISGGEGMQNIQDVLYVPNSTVVLMSTDTSQIWRSEDGGKNWKWSGDGIPAHGVKSMAVDRFAKVLYAAAFHGESGLPAAFSKAESGIFKSTNMGKSWTKIYNCSFTKSKSSGKVLLHGVVGGQRSLIAAAKDQGVLLSTNNGESWNKVSDKLGHVYGMDIDEKNGGVVYIASESGLYSYNAKRLDKISGSLPSNPVSVSIGNNPDRMYVACELGGIFVSTDYGASFKSVLSYLIPKVSFNNVVASKSDGNMVLATPNMPAMYSGVHVSRDSGKSWAVVSKVDDDRQLPMSRLGQWFFSPIAINDADKKNALVGVNGFDTIIRTENGGANWKYSASGFMGGRMLGMTFLKKGCYFVALQDFGLWYTENSGAHFYKMPIERMYGEESVSAVDAVGEKIVASIGLTLKKGLALSENFGKTWRTIDAVTGNLNFVKIHKTNPSWIMAGQHISKDNGKTWKRLKYQIYACNQGDNNILYGIDPVGAATKVVVSRDCGESWSALPDALPVSAVDVVHVVSDPGNPQRIWVGTNYGLYAILNGRVTPPAKIRGLPKDRWGLSRIERLAISTANPSEIYLGMRSIAFGPGLGVFRSKDGGMSWENINLNLPKQLEVWGLEYDDRSAQLYVGSSLGTYRMP